MSQAGNQEDEEFLRQKTEVVDKIADTLYKKEFKYLEFLNYMLTDGVQQTTIDGCPMLKCKCKRQMTVTELREHLVNECTKVTLECSVC